MNKVVPIFAALAIASPALGDSLPLSVDTSKTKEPISKYIYGQFVEHLGRSIYGGLWAEMIEDRKFCHPITDNYDSLGTDTAAQWNAGPYHFLKASPWKVIGPPGTVTMDKEHPYTGEQTPVIHLKGDGTEAGISQGGGKLALSIVKGKRYVGRVVLAGDASAGTVTIACSYSPSSAAAPVVNRAPASAVPDPTGGMSGIWTELKACSVNDLATEFKSYSFEFAAPESSDEVTLTITAKGKGSFKIGAISLMPADNIDGWRADTVAALKQLNTPILRWPGGNFVSGYNWRDGINPDKDKRPPRQNPAWHNIEANDVGIHEYMDLLSLIGAEPYVALNTGKGSPEEAANEVQYIIGGTDTLMGTLRAQNGHPDPWKEKYWAVGNEMYGTWQLGYMPLAQYEQKHNTTAQLIWKIDPDAQLVACGDANTTGWDTGMLTNCGDDFNLLSEHTYVKEIKGDVAAHAAQLRDSIHKVAVAFRGYQAALPIVNQRKIKIAFDEWNYWYGDYIYGELGVQYHLKDALGVAMGLHEFYRNSDIFFMAAYAQTVNVLGAIKTSPTAVSLEATALPLILYREHFGTIPIDIQQPSPDLDIAAAWTDDKTALTIAIINRTMNDHQLALDLGNLAVKQTATQWEIKGTDPEAHNVPGQPPEVKIKERPFTFAKVLPAPPLSIELYRLETH